MEGVRLDAEMDDISGGGADVRSVEDASSTCMVFTAPLTFPLPFVFLLRMLLFPFLSSRCVIHMPARHVAGLGSGFALYHLPFSVSFSTGWF